jgi:hypothetical protein
MSAVRFAEDERVARLPRWAQDLIARQNRDLRVARKIIEEMKGADPRKPLAVRDVWDEAVPVAWGQYDAITFFPNGSDNENVWLSFRVREPGSVEVMTSATLHVTMSSSNVAVLRTGRRVEVSTL